MLYQLSYEATHWERGQFIEFIQLQFKFLLPFVSVTCSPHETFKDLVKKLETGDKRTELEKVTFAMRERVFDPDQDKASLQGKIDTPLKTVKTLE